jgi:hypothetical protein
MWMAKSFRQAAVAVALVISGPAALADQYKEINLWVGRNVAPGPKVRLNINTRNVPIVHMAVYPIDGTSWLRHFPGEPASKPATTGPAIRQWNVTVAQKGQAPRYGQADAYFSRQINMPIIQPGVFLVSATGGGKEAWGVVNVTNLAVVAKRSPHRLLVWVTDALKGNVLKGAEVATYDRKGQKTASGRTGADGVCIVPMDPGEDGVVVSRGGDRAGLFSTGERVDGRLRAHFQTDRPLYRPGQTIQYRVLLRRTLGQGYRNLAGQKVAVEFRDPKDDVLDKADLTASALGSVASKFDVPSEGMLGNYTLVVRTGNDEARTSVEVAEYRKPEFKVDAVCGAKRYLAGENAEVRVDAQYYFGAPVPQGQVSYQITRSDYALFPGEDSDRFDDGNLYATDTYRGNPNIASGVVYTDKDGNAKIGFHTDKAAPDSTYDITVTVQDSSRRQVVAATSVPVYAANLRIGLQTDVLCAPLGSLVPVQVRAVDLDGKPCAAKVTLIAYKSVWIEKEGRYKQVEVARIVAQLPPTGHTVVNLPANAPDEMLVEASALDGTGRTAKAQLPIYVIGPFEKGEREQEEPEVTVHLDRRSYKPGDIVHAYVVTNVPKNPILATLEGGDLFAYKVFLPGKNSHLWTIPTDRALCPNAFLGVAQWADLQPLSGNAQFALPDETRAITVKAVPDRQDYRPGDKATYKLTTTDSKGRPIPAELTMSVVDEAIYALAPDNTPDMWNWYWGARPTFVATTTSAPEELSGGAYQANNGFGGGGRAPHAPVAPVRTRFEDTAYWDALVETGDDGKAEVSFEMPGNLTTWRATARATSAETSVGTATAFVKANRQVMLRLATPRQMVQGDQIQLIGTIDNRSPDAHDFDASLTATDIAVSGDAVKHVSVPGKSQAKVEWTLSADRLPASGSAQLLGEISVPDAPADQAVDLADALKVPLRVVPRGVEERFLAGGTVTADAEADLEVPSDHIPGAGKVTVTAWVGLQAALDAAANEVLGTYMYGTIGAADHLQVDADTGVATGDPDVKECLALLAKNQSASGWGWWEFSSTDPVVTARVMTAIGHAAESGIEAYDPLVDRGRANLVDLFKNTNLLEHRALLAAAAAFSGENKALDMLGEVLPHAEESVSPFARLEMAEALAMLQQNDDAGKLLESVLKDMSDGPAEAFIPCGDGIGWSATEVETTAQGLATLARMGRDPDLQLRLARWLVSPGEHWWRCGSENAAVVRALKMYLKAHPEAGTLGPVEVEIAGHKVVATPAKVGASATAEIPAEWLSSGKNTFTVHRTEPGAALFKVEARLFRPGLYENSKGIRVLRRFEVRDPAGVWRELNRKVKPSETVRCTVVVWGDDLNDAVRVVEPMPSGFEYVGSESFDYGRTEVRDAAVVNYLVNAGAPQVFRFYLRAESEGRLVALPATAEYLRRPSARGQSVAQPVEVEAGK